MAGGSPKVAHGSACFLVTDAFIFKIAFCFLQVTLADHTPDYFQNSYMYIKSSFNKNKLVVVQTCDTDLQRWHVTSECWGDRVVSFAQPLDQPAR